VTLRLVRKLLAIDLVEDENIRDFENHVATLTYRTIYDFMRDHYPERTRSRIASAMSSARRSVALWNTADGVWTARVGGRDDVEDPHTCRMVAARCSIATGRMTRSRTSADGHFAPAWPHHSFCAAATKNADAANAVRTRTLLPASVATDGEDVERSFT
jgi:hypothetical protein